jgi:hypothetical protein
MAENLYKASNASSRTQADGLTWTASEYIEHSRGSGWYMALAIATIALAAIFYLFLDKMAPIIVVILGATVGFTAGRKPREINYELSSDGLAAGEKFYEFSQFKSFSIIREGLLNSLLLTPLKRFMPPVSVYFEAADEEAIVEIISQHLPIENRSPDKIDTLSRRLRF